MALRAGTFQPSERHLELIQKMRDETATDREKSEFMRVHRQTSNEILDRNTSDLFTLEPVQIEPPPKARIELSSICDRCGEPTMASKLQKSGNGFLCRNCIETIPEA